MKTLLLFDLDGTLLLTHGAGVRSMQRAGQQVWGGSFSLDGVMIGGGLDPLILKQALSSLGHDLEHDAHERFKAMYLQELQQELTSNPSAHALPGVPELLSQVRNHEGSLLGLLTGNYSSTGIAKLRAVNIEHSWFDISIWGDEADTRPGLVQVAMARAGNVTPERVVVIGDTPRDIDCAARNGCRSIAVATGGYSREELQDAGADLVLDDLSNASALWAFIED